MTATATEPTATVTLPVWTLQAIRVRALATAALVALDLARREAYWASPEGRAASDRMWCGEQDAVGDRLDALRARIADEQATADALAAAITAAGYEPLSTSDANCLPLSTAYTVANLSKFDKCRDTDLMRCNENLLRDYLAGKR
jgi:hypothetical protein